MIEYIEKFYGVNLMEHKAVISEDKSWPVFHAFMAVALLVFYMLCPVAPVRWHDLYLSYGRIAIISMAAVYFWKRRFDGVIELRLVIWYTLWLFVTRLLNTDYYLQNELDLVISRVLCCVVLPTGLILKPAQRERALDICIGIVCAFYLVVAILGITACFFSTYFYIPPENVVFGIDSSYFYNTFCYLTPLSTNRTVSAVWFYICWCLMIYEFLKCRRKLWRIPIALAWFVFTLAIALSFCRSVKLAVCINAAMLVLLWGQKALHTKKAAVRALILAVLAAAALPLTYKGFDLITSGTQALYDFIDLDVESRSDDFLFTADGNGEVTKFSDTRDLGKSLSNMSNRSSIYASVVPAMKDDPLRLLIGKYSSKLMDIPHLYQNYPYYHMHNYVLQTLMLTGLIGCLLVVAFSVLLVFRMIKLFFSASPLASAAIKSLTLPLSGILVYGMMETVIFTNCADERAATDFRELAFFLIAGIVLAYYYDIYPPETRADRGSK